jgi:nucleoid-associated protein YgaU
MSMDGASYIGTLLVENIAQKKKGSTSIELIVSYSKDGEFSATAYDIDKPEEKTKALLIVSMPPGNDSTNLEDFEFEREKETGDEFAVAVKRPNTSRPMIIAFASVLIVLAMLALWSFVLRVNSAQNEALPQSQTEAPLVEVTPAPPTVTPVIPPPEPSAEPVLSAEPAPSAVEPVAEPPQKATAPTPVVEPQTRASRERSAAPVASTNPPAVIPSGGLRYRLRWGDTLWDVSQAFYRTPWHYRYIARYNGIRNPNRIVSGRTITIPPPPR